MRSSTTSLSTTSTRGLDRLIRVRDHHSGVCESRGVGPSGAVASLVVVVLPVTLLASGRVLDAAAGRRAAGGAARALARSAERRRRPPPRIGAVAQPYHRSRLAPRQTIRHRPSRGGDRQLNRALHTVILHRRQHDPATRAYIDRRIAEGKSSRDATRALKRYLARHLYRVMQNTAAAMT
jgi:hypothetical protein